MALSIPSIHMNGTHQAALIEEARDAQEMAQMLLVRIERMTVNARDFYPQGPGAYVPAAAAHRDLIARAKQIDNELRLYCARIEAGGHQGVREAEAVAEFELFTSW